MTKTKIQWTGYSWNPIRARDRNSGKIGWQCEIITPGCENCYASVINKRFGTGLSYLRGLRGGVEVFLDEKILTQPLRWRSPKMIFVMSMSDLFGEWVPDEMIDKIHAVMALTPQHTYQVLTKRHGRMQDYALRPSLFAHIYQAARTQFPDIPVPPIASWPLMNCWAGVSVEDQRRADERIPVLIKTPAAVRWISLEPQLGPVELDQLNDGTLDSLTGNWAYGPDQPHLDWVVVGGESGPHARPFNIEWARSIIAQCKAASVACFVKQMGARVYQHGNGGKQRVLLRHRKGGEPAEWPADLRVREYPAQERA